MNIKNNLKTCLLPFVQSYNKDFVLDVCGEGFGFTYNDSNIKIYVDFRKLIKPIGISFQANSTNISLKNIEDKIQCFLTKYGFEKLSYNNTLRSMPYLNKEPALSVKRSVSEIEIITESDFLEVVERIKNYLSILIFPFLDRYASLEGVNDALNLMTFKETMTYIGGTFPVQFYKAMYISYVAGNFVKYESIKAELPLWFEKAKNYANMVNEVLQYEKAYHALIEMLEK